MRAVWSETTKRRIWRRVWFAVAQAQAAAGLVTPRQVDEIQAHLSQVDIARSLALEAEIGHDLVAELMAFAEQCPTAGGVLHWGLTSADVQDNTDIIRQKTALTLLLKKLRILLLNLAGRIEATADIPVLGYTHLQPAEPTTLGYRFSGYAQDLFDHFEALNRLRLNLRGKGIKGAVGTAAPFVEMLADTSVTAEMLEATVMEALDIQPFPITTQTYPRVQDYTLLSMLAGLAASLHKFAFDLRMMQSPGFRAAAEPFGERQVGSSSMPFKRNPVRAEKICSLARHLIAAAEIAWQNASANLLERTLDDSANRRSAIPESFLALDEMLITADEIVQGMVVDRMGSASWLETYGVFAATERLLTALVKAGADRQEMHSRLREHSLQAWEALQQGKPNPLRPRLTSDAAILHFLQPAHITELLEADGYLGLAPQRAREMAKQIKDTFAMPAE
jgi:adenylosuccinate lyase